MIGLKRGGIALAMLSVSVLAQTQPTTDSTQPTTGPATTQAATRPSADVSTAAAPLLKNLAAAYAHAQPLKISGTIHADLDVAGRRKTYTLQISGSTDGNGKFFHYGAGAGLLVNDGKNAYLYDERRNTYAELEPFIGRADPDNLSEAISDVLLDENPVLLLTLTTDADALLRRLAQSIRLAGDVKNALVIELKTKRITFEIDPSTSRLMRSTIDYTPVLKSRDAVKIISAKAILDYAEQSAALPAKPDNYAWSPPATANQFTLSGQPLHSTTQPVKPPNGR